MTLMRLERHSYAATRPMTDTDRQQFFDLFAAMCRAFDRKIDQSVCAEYFDGLKDYPVHIVERAKANLRDSAKFWPKVRDWRQACDSVRAAGRTPFIATQTAQDESGELVAVYHCRHCQDSGWRPACGCAMGSLNDRGECERHQRQMYGLVYRQAMMLCGCRDGNPVFQANRPRVTGAAREAGGGRE